MPSFPESPELMNVVIRTYPVTGSTYDIQVFIDGRQDPELSLEGGDEEELEELFNYLINTYGEEDIYIDQYD